jgi:hypothetical protein
MVAAEVGTGNDFDCYCVEPEICILAAEATSERKYNEGFAGGPGRDEKSGKRDVTGGYAESGVGVVHIEPAAEDRFIWMRRTSISN